MKSEIQHHIKTLTKITFMAKLSFMLSLRSEIVPSTRDYAPRND